MTDYPTYFPTDCRYIQVRDECVNYTWGELITKEFFFWVIGVLAFIAVLYIVLYLSGKAWAARIISGAAMCGQDAISDWYLVFYWFSQGDKYWATSMLCSILFGGLASFFTQKRTDSDDRGKFSLINLLIDLSGFNFMRTVPLE